MLLIAVEPVIAAIAAGVIGALVPVVAREYDVWCVVVLPVICMPCLRINAMRSSSIT